MTDDNREDQELTLEERAFFAELSTNGYRIGEAYRKALASKGTKKSTQESGSKMLARIKAKTKAWGEILALAGIDDHRLAAALADKLQAKATQFYQGKAVATVEDNRTQMAAVELVADLLGKRTNKVSLEGTLGGVLLVQPQQTEADWEKR